MKNNPLILVVLLLLLYNPKIPDQVIPDTDGPLQILVIAESSRMTFNTQQMLNDPEFRKLNPLILDPDTNVSKLSKSWQDAFNQPRQSDFWIVIKKGSRGVSQPLPTTPEGLSRLIDGFRN